jgi:hypothetical protein
LRPFGSKPASWSDFRKDESYFRKDEGYFRKAKSYSLASQQSWSDYGRAICANFYIIT